MFRSASEQEAPTAVVEALNNGASVESVWDAILCAAGELLMRKTNILTLHAVTSANALHYAYKAAGGEQERLMLLLQNAAFIPLFRQGVEKQLSSSLLDEISPPANADAVDSVDAIFAEVSNDRASAARKALAYLEGGHDPKELMHAARRFVFLKGNDAHDYKYSSAVLEDFYAIAPKWRNRYLATSMYYLPGSGSRDNSLVERIRAAFSA